MSQPSIRKRFDRQTRYGRILGLLFAAVGFAVIGFGWNGAARFASVDQQFPYLISGGVGGLALVLLGVGLLAMAQLRAERAKLEERVEHLGTLLSKAAAASAPTGAQGADGRVVAGKSTYHRPDCRLVKGKPDLDYVSVEAARVSGLSPCRVCDPEKADESSAEGGAGAASGRRRRSGSRKA